MDEEAIKFNASTQQYFDHNENIVNGFSHISVSLVSNDAAKQQSKSSSENNSTNSSNDFGNGGSSEHGESGTNNSSSLASSPLMSGTFSFGNCRICSDKATGIHYGAASCEACKGFYKRCTLRKENYVCFSKNNCKITSKNRGNCKACRLRRCIEAGMSLYGVKMGRIPAAVKQQITNSLKESSDNTIGFNPNKITMPSMTTTAAATTTMPITTIDSATPQHHPATVGSSVATTSTTSTAADNENAEKYEQQRRQQHYASLAVTSSGSSDGTLASSNDDQIIKSIAMTAPPFRDSNLMSEAVLCNLFGQTSVQNDKVVLLTSLLNNKVSQLYVDFTKDTTWMTQRARSIIESGGHDVVYSPTTLQEVVQGLASLPARSYGPLVRFACELPGLRSVLSDEVLSKHLSERRYEMGYVKSASVFINDESYYFVNDKVRLSLDMMEKIFGPYYTNEMRQFAKLFNSLHLTHREQALICALLLTAPDDNNPNSSEFLEFQKLYAYYMRAILYEFDLNRRDTSFLNKLSTILVKLSHLGKLNKEFQQQTIRNLS